MNDLKKRSSKDGMAYNNFALNALIDIRNAEAIM
jgi:hypothetical protein